METRNDSEQSKWRTQVSGIFYKSIQKLAEKLGCPDMFDLIDFEDSNERTHKFCKWIKENDKTPSQHSKNIEEKQLGIFLSTRKKAKGGKGNSLFYKSDQKIAESYGLKELFENTDLEADSNERTHKLCKWIKENDKNPSQQSKNIEEKQLGKFLSTKKMAKGGKGNSLFYKSDQKIAESYGLKELFENTDLEADSNERTHKLCKWIKENDKNPLGKSKNIEEKQLGIFLSTKKTAKGGKGESRFYKSDQKIVESYGLKELFENIDPEADSNEKTHELCKWIKENDKNPSGKSKNIEEKQLGNFLSIRKKAKGGKGGNFYKSDQKIAESYGLKELFDTIDREADSNERTHKLCKWIKENDKTPSNGSKNIEEKQLGNFLSKKKMAKGGKGNWKLYKSDQKIAESYGMKDLFEITRGPRMEGIK